MLTDISSQHILTENRIPSHYSNLNSIISFFLLDYGEINLRVLVLDINFKKDERSGKAYPWITGRLRSGLEIEIQNFFYDLQGYIGHHVEMLLCVLRAPILEYEKGINNQPFSPEKYYSVELIDELLKKKGFNSKDNGSQDIILTGEYIDSYVIPEKWIPLMEPNWFRRVLKEPSAIKTDDGIFLLYPFHLRKNVPIERFPKIVTIATGCIDLAAWHPIP